MDHLWNCPAFRAEREELFKEMTIDIGLPFAERFVPSQEESFCQRLARSAQSILLEQRNSRFLTFERLKLLACDFWRANEHKSIPPISSFKSLVQSLIPRCACEGKHSQSCGSPNLVVIPESLLRILTEHLSLSVEGNTADQPSLMNGAPCIRLPERLVVSDPSGSQPGGKECAFCGGREGESHKLAFRLY